MWSICLLKFSTGAASGASKGDGVSWLLQHLGRSPAGLLALGDGENDIEMLQLAAVGVAMGNAGGLVTWN